jgi:hypothetical protein
VRIVEVAPGAGLTVRGLTLANGRVTGVNGTKGVNGESVRGAAILNIGGDVSLVDCEITNNRAIGGRGDDILFIFGGAAWWVTGEKRLAGRSAASAVQ